MAHDVCPETRWAWVQIDRNALRHNTRAFKQLLPSGVKLMCVVKADAYGHGAAACAKVMMAAGADQFAVATVDEGVSLRETVKERPIVMLSEPPISAIETLLDHRITPSVFTREFALAYGEAAAARDEVAPYHMVLDTGMTRIGVPWDEAVEWRSDVEFHRGIQCVGTFTHFATADVPGDWDWALQNKRFEDAVAAMEEAGFDCGLVHCDNTPATVLHSETHHDMVRVGIGLYGLHPALSTETRISLKPVMSVKAKVTRVVNPAVGSGVSYGMTYRVPKPQVQIATLPIGYADGLSRVLSGRMDVLVDGMRCRQVGNICMDQCMFAVEVNEIRQFAPTRPIVRGATVTILGTDGDDTISAEDLAEAMGTINYEVVCALGSMRLPRVYV